MVAQLETRVLDFGLTVITNEASLLVLTEAEPTNYALASIGNPNVKGFSLVAFSAPTDHSVNGRCVISSAIVDGSITTTGSVNWWAAVDGTSARLLARAEISNGREMSAGNSWALGAFQIRIPAQ